MTSHENLLLAQSIDLFSLSIKTIPSTLFLHFSKILVTFIVPALPCNNHSTSNLSMYLCNDTLFFFFSRYPSIGSEEELSSEDKELEWPQYTVDTRLYKELAPEMNNIVDPTGGRCRVWNDFLPKLDVALGNYNYLRVYPRFINQSLAAYQ